MEHVNNGMKENRKVPYIYTLQVSTKHVISLPLFRDRSYQVLEQDIDECTTRHPNKDLQR